MAKTKPSKIDYTDMSNAVDLINVPSEETSPQDYQMDWGKWHGYYYNINAFSSLVDKKSIWCIGKGFEADKKTTAILNDIRGCGKDSFNTIMQNAVKVYSVCGDFLAEIVKNKRGKLVNLKPLNPGTFKITANDYGIITGYEQVSNLNPSRSGAKGKMFKKFKPDEIFHLAWNRMADNIHGTGTTEKMENDLKRYEEVVRDQRIIFNRYVKPLWVFSVDADDDAELAAFKVKVDQTVNKSENLVVPKDTVDKIDRMSIPANSTLDPLPWIKFLESQFLKAEGVPAIVQGISTGGSESESKVLYLAWQQVVEWNQLFLEEQIRNQLGLKVEFNFPAMIEPDIKRDEKKDGGKGWSDGNRDSSTGKFQ